MDRAFGGGAGTFLAICARNVDSSSFRVVQGMDHRPVAQRVEILKFVLLLQCVSHLRPLDNVDNSIHAIQT